MIRKPGAFTIRALFRPIKLSSITSKNKENLDCENEVIIFAAVALSHGEKVAQVTEIAEIAKAEATIGEQRRVELRIKTSLWRKQ